MNTYLKSLLSICLITSLLLVTISVYGQETDFSIPDSLKSKSPEQLIQRIITSSPKEASFYEIALLSNLREDTDLARKYYRIAFHFYDAMKYQKSIEYFNKVIEVAKKPRDTELLNVIHLNIGNAYKSLGEDAYALDSYYLFLRLSKKHKNINYEFIANTNIAIIHRRMGQFKEALQKSLHALRLIDKTPDKNKENHVNTLTVISETYLDLKKYDSVIYYADKGLKISDSLDYKLGLADLWIKKGIVFSQKKDYAEAFNYLFKAENLLENHQIKNSFLQKIAVNYFIASCFYNNEEYEKAIAYLQKNIEISKREKLKKTYALNTYYYSPKHITKQIKERTPYTGMMNMLI